MWDITNDEELFSIQDKTPLKIPEDFNKYLYKTKSTGQWIFRFDNNYGASVIKHFGSYGFEDDLFELAVIFFDGDNWKISYNTPITDNVIGYLTNNDIIKYLNEIKKLK